MRKRFLLVTIMITLLLPCSGAFAAYHHEGEKDAEKFLTAYPDLKGTKLDHCALCHSGGKYEKKPGSWVELGSCQWCHKTYGYDGAGDIEETMNPYGKAFKAAGRNADAVTAIDGQDSDGDGYLNKAEIEAGRFPGSADDHPGLQEAPYRVYTKAQLEAMNQHTQFLLMNTSRSGDFYVEYSGVPMKDLLDDAGILSSATGIKVYAPDGWSQYHPLEYEADLDMYHVYGNEPGQSYQYPPATYYYDLQADDEKNPNVGWCNYSSVSCSGRSHGDAIHVDGGLKAILAIKRDGADLTPGVLNDDNKLDGEGPFRLVVPQKYVNAPDQSSKSDDQDVIWPYVYEWDHNAGSCTRSSTIIKVEPLPEGTTDINVLEAGWNYVDKGNVVVYGAIDGTDSNGNGIPDSEEKNGGSDCDGDGIPDYQDSDTACLRPVTGIEPITINSSKGDLAQVKALSVDDPSIPADGKPADATFPYGSAKFNIVGLAAGDSVEVKLVFPENVPTSAKYYKIAGGKWNAIPFESNDGDNTIVITLRDGDSATDADGVENGTIVDPGTLAVEASSSSGGGGGSCFINTLLGF